MKIIIPVAGRGTRVQPHTFSKPKPLFKIANKPAICHIIDKLKVLDIEEIILIVDKFNIDIFKKIMPELYPNYKISFVLQEKPEGPAHALWLTKDLIKPGDKLLINFCDTLFEHDMSFLNNLDPKYDGLIFVKEVEDYRRFGVVVAENDIMKLIVEKPDQPISKLANIGTYYFQDGHDLMLSLQKMIDKNLKVKGEYYLPEAFMLMVYEQKKIFVQEVDEWLDTGKIETILDTHKKILKGKNLQEENVKLEGTKLEGNVAIAKNSTLKNCKIKDSIIGENTTLEGLEIHDSIIGDNVVIKKGGKVFNVGDKSTIV